jgi:hypothetical protein
MGMVVISSTLMVGPVTASLDEEGRPMGDGGAALQRAFPRFAEDLEWWAEASRRQRNHRTPPY